MNTKELLKKVRKIEIKTRRLSDNIFGGEYLSAFKGKGMAFSEVRQYQYGDDIRTIDWNVTARQSQPHIKVFEEERELTMMLAIDVSGSKNFGTKNYLKSEFVTEIAATLAFSANQNNDKVGLILFSDKVELYIPPKKGRSHVLRIIRELIEFKPTSKKTSINEALRFLSSVLKKRSILFIFSDFIDNDYEQNLNILSKRHDVTGCRVYDKAEMEIPNLGLVQMVDQESGEVLLINTGFSKVRNRYMKQQKLFVSYFENSFKKSGGGNISFRTDDNYVRKLLGYFKKRG